MAIYILTYILEKYLHTSTKWISSPISLVKYVHSLSCNGINVKVNSQVLISLFVSDLVLRCLQKSRFGTVSTNWLKLELKLPYST